MILAGPGGVPATGRASPSLQLAENSAYEDHLEAGHIGLRRALQPR